jgi:hypothetical protein
MAKIEINTEKVFADFKNHIEIKGNNKIIFSAKYGTGKSYFLNNFFEHKQNKKKYNLIPISPINYSVSQNEDIFELIKADIIRAFFLNGTLNFESGDLSFDKLTVVKEYLKHSINHPYKIGKQLIHGLAKIGTMGTVAEKGIDSIFTIIDDFENFEKKLNENYRSDDNKLEEFSNEMQNKIGSYLEYNFISGLIKEILQGVKKIQKKENVLLIDDFDRLDPAHIFRILNILSAHSNENENKFGFDKVIIVCDLYNIEKLYKHLYGSQIDFEGYIDKFYSFSPYYFDNTKAIHYFLNNNFTLPVEKYATDAFVHLLKTLDNKSKIRLRKFDKSTRDQINSNNTLLSFDHTYYQEQFAPYATYFVDNKTKSLNIFCDDVPLIKMVKFLKNLYGGYNELINILELNKNFVGRLDSELSLNYLKLLIIPNKLNSPKNEYYKLFFKETNSYEYPELAVGNGNIKIITNWNHIQKYSEGSFYQNMTMVYNGHPNFLMDFDLVLDVIIRFINVGLDENWID